MVWYSMPWVRFGVVFLATLCVWVSWGIWPWWGSVGVLGLFWRRHWWLGGVGVASVVLGVGDFRDVSGHAWVVEMEQGWSECLELRVSGAGRYSPWGVTVDLASDEGVGVRGTFLEGVPLPGERIWACAEWRGFARRSVPWTTDYRDLMHRRGFAGRGVVDEWEVISDEAGVSDRVLRGISGRRHALEEFVVGGLESPWSGLVIAMTTGNSTWLDEKVLQAYSDTGTSHILAISGSHFAVVAGVCWWICVGVMRRSVWVSRRFGARRAAAVFVLLGCAFYVVFVGAPASAQRAFVASVMLGCAVMWVRHVCPFHMLSTALVVVLVVEPTACLEIGFQLSFVATFGILLFNRYRPAWLERGHMASSRWRRWGRSVGMFVGVSVSASVATVPILMMHFGFLCLWTIPLNLVIVPVVSLVVFPLMMVGHAVSWVWAAGGLWVLGASAHPLMLCIDVLVWCAGMGVLNWVPGALPWGPVAGLGLSAWLLLVSRCERRRLCVGLCCGALAVWWSNGVNEPGDRVWVDFIDVGQGDSTLVRAPGLTVLVDAGGRLMGRDPGRSQVVPYLRQTGVKRVDVFVITHADLDHRGGARAVLELVDVGKLMIHPHEDDALTQELVVFARSRGVEVIREAWRWEDGQAIVTRLPPALPGKNDRSIVVELDAWGHTVGLHGDLEEAGEAWWVLEHGRRLDFMKMPHHGSSTSSSEALLGRAQPVAAMSSAGRHNSFGHPRPAVVERYHRMGASTFHTHEVGAIRLELSESGMSVYHGM